MVGGDDGCGSVSESPQKPQHPSSKQSPFKLALAGDAFEDLDRLNLDPHDHEALRGIDHWQDIRLKKSYARWLLIMVAAQLVVADAVFIAYAWAGEGWHLDKGVIQVWLGATLVELVGVVLVVTQYLFPKRERGSIES